MYRIDENIALDDAQMFNQSLLTLAMLLYHADNKITLTELDYFEQLTDEIQWNSPISLEAFINDQIHVVRQAIENEESRELLKSISRYLKWNPQKAMEVAFATTGIDGMRCQAESDILEYLSHKLLPGLNQTEPLIATTD